MTEERFGREVKQVLDLGKMEFRVRDRPTGAQLKNRVSTLSPENPALHATTYCFMLKKKH